MYQARVHNSTRSEKSEVLMEVSSEGNTTLPVGNSPAWERELQNVVVQEREKGVELVCSCRNLTNPTAMWYHKGREVFSDFHMKLRQVEDTAILTIKEIRQRDTGEFRCVMAGENGELETSCVLTIKTAEEMEPPVFVKELHDMEVEEGEKLELDVEIRGARPVRVMWYHNNVKITQDSPHYLLASLGNIHTLILLHAIPESSGEYVCEAYNEFGDADTFCFIEVREVEHPEPPDFLTHPMTLTAQEGETMTFTCQVKGQPMPSVLWERGGVVIATNQKYKITKIQDQHSLIVYNTDQSDAGEYICHLNNTEGDKSQAFRLHISSDKDSRGFQDLQNLSSRSSHMQQTQMVVQLDSESHARQENISGSPITSRKFKHAEIYEMDDKYITGDGRLEKSYETATVTNTHDIFVTQAQTSESNSNSRQTTRISNQNSRYRDSRIQPNLSENVTDFRSVLSKSHRKVEDKKSNVKTDVTDFRSVLKHRDSSQPHDSGKATVTQSHQVDFRKVLSQDKQKHQSKHQFEVQAQKEDNATFQMKNLSTNQASNKIISQNNDLTLVSYSTPSSSNIQLNQNQIVNVIHKKDDSFASYTGSGIDQNNFDKTGAFRDSQGELPQCSETEVQSAGSSGKITTQVSFSFQNIPPNSTAQKSDSTSEILGINKQFPLSEDGLVMSDDISGVSLEPENLLHVVRDNGSEFLDTNTNEPLFRSEIQIMETRTRRRDNIKTFPTEENQLRMSISTSPTPAGIHLGSDRATKNVTPKNPNPQNTVVKSDLTSVVEQPHKVSLIHVMPETVISSSEGLKLEVTSVSISVPLRSSTSSPRSHSQQHSASASANSTPCDFTDIKHEVDDDVFADSALGRRSSLPEQNEFRTALQTMGSAFTWEKAPWDMEQLSTEDSSNDSQFNKIIDTTGNKIPDVEMHHKNNSVTTERGFQSEFSTVSKSQAVFNESTATSNKSSHTSALKKDLGADFRTVKLRHTGHQNRPGSLRNRTMSASMENVSSDLRLKSAPKTFGNWKKSQISSSGAEIVHARYKGRDSYEPQTATSHINFHKNVPKQNITNSTSSSRFSDALKTFQSEAKSPVQTDKIKNEKYVQNSKIKSATRKFDRPCSDDSMKTVKSRGIGAVFEKSIKNAKTASGNDSYTSASGTRNNLRDTKPPDISQKQLDITASNSRRVLDKLQHWKAAEISVDQKAGKKMLKDIGKSKSENARKSYIDTILERDKHKRHSLQMSTAPVSETISQKYAHKNDIYRLSIDTPYETSVLHEKISRNPPGNDPSQNLDDVRTTDNLVSRVENAQETSKSGNTGTEKADVLHAGNAQSKQQDIKNVQSNKHEVSKASLKSVQNELSSTPEWVNRTALKNVNVKIEAKRMALNEKESGKQEWVKLRPVQNTAQSGSSNKNSETDIGLRCSSRVDQTPKVTATDTLESSLIIKFESKSTFKHTESNQRHLSDEKEDNEHSKNWKSLDDSVSEKDFYTAETVAEASATSAKSKFVASPKTTFTTTSPATGVFEKWKHQESASNAATTVRPAIAPRRRPAATEVQPNVSQKSNLADLSTHDKDLENLKKESPVSYSSSSRSADETSSSQIPASSLEGQLISLKSGRSLWSKQKNLQQIPVHLLHDSDPLILHEIMKSSMDDSESVLSTASISSTSSDASNMTNDSGYQRSHSRAFVDIDKIQSLSETLWPENSAVCTNIFHSNKLEGKMEVVGSDIYKTRTKSRERHSETKNKHVQNSVFEDHDQKSQFQGNGQNYVRKFIKEIQDESYKSEAKPDYSQVPVKNETDNTLAYVGHMIDDNIQTKIHQGKEITESANQSPEGANSNSRDSETLTGRKENEEVVDLTNDFGTTRKYSKKRRKNQEKEVNNTTGNAATEATVSITEESKITARHEIVQNETDTKLTRSIPDTQDKPESRWQSKERRSNFRSEMRESHSESSRRRSRSRDYLDKDNDKVNDDTHDGDNKPLVRRPSDLELNQTWKNQRLRTRHLLNDSEVTSSKSSDSENIKVRSVTNEVETSFSPAAGSPSATESSATNLSLTSPSESQEKPSPPSFPIPLRDVTVSYGSKAVLHCQVIGVPRPEVKWLLNYKHIEPSSNIEIVYSDTFAQLSIKETFREHVGDVTCWAKNSLGTVSSHCTLNVTASNKTDGRALEGPVFLPPRIVSLTQSASSLARGSLLTLTATFVGEPKPLVTWILNNKELTSDGRVQIVTEGNTSCLTIKSVVRSDAGKMSVCLASCSGTDQASANICIEDVPGTPVGQPHVYDIDSNSASLSWCGPVSSEQSQVTHFIIEAKTRQQKAWDVIVPHCKDLCCHILNLKPCTTYQFRVLAANMHGISSPSEPSESVITSDSFRSPSDYESEAFTEVFSPSHEFRGQDELPFDPREVEINTTVKFEDVYEVDQEVGKGKFGVVYKCKRKEDGTVWAAKIVKCRDRDKSVIRKEIDIMNKLRHPKLLLLWDAYESSRQMVLVTEYVGAGELFERVVGEDFILTEHDCIHFLRQICDGVSYMHSLNILHLDLKPENILCMAENSNRIKIIDFGLAQYYQPGQSTKVLFGTPEFIAPEVVNYDEIGFVTDMWSIGVICYVLLSGLSPFLGDNDAETLANVTSGDFDFDDEAFEEISAEAKDFISKLLVMKKEKRMLTHDCMSHVWLKGNEAHGKRCRRLNTERLKRFMVRRKWLKTGNAVKAVGRLMNMKSSLTNLGLNATNDSKLTPEISESPVSSTHQQTERNSEHFKVQNASDLEGNYLHQHQDKRMENLSQDLGKITEEKFSDLEKISRVSDIGENSSPKNFRNQQDSNTLINRSGNGTSIHSLPQPRARIDGQRGYSTDQNDNMVVNSISQSVVASNPDMNHNVKQAASSSAAVRSRTLENVLVSTTKNRLQVDKAKQMVSGADGLAPQAPVFVKSMKNTQTCTGDVARFDVVVFGDPFPSVTWFFEDKEICSGSRHVLNCNENTRTFSLVIRGIVEEDEGEYICKAVNSQGEILCAAELSVLEI